MSFTASVAISKGALVAPSESFGKKRTILSRQGKTYKNTRGGYAPLSVKCFKGHVGPLPGLLDDVTNGIPSKVTLPDCVKRSDFPRDFYFGGSTSALQTEGTGTEGGRGPSTWDPLFGDLPGSDSYHLYKEDVKALKKMGATAYRFSISWPRILPNGTLNCGVNREGINFYNKFIDELIDNDITPIVTLMHFDLPLALQIKYKGFLSKNIVEDFKDYADVCFHHFGDRVKFWSTMNEPQVFGQYGYKSTDIFLVSHHLILAHAAATKLYKEKYQRIQKGDIGISLVCLWYKPYTDNDGQDKDAAERAFDFLTGWFLEPLVNGDYPFIMRALVRDGLPEFSKEEKDMVKGAYDFIGINYYTSRFAKNIPYDPHAVYNSSDAYQFVEQKVENSKGQLIGDKIPGEDKIYVCPEGLRDALIYISKEYGNPKIYITENGYPERLDDSIPMKQALKDDGRVQLIISHLNAIKEAMKEGADVNGYFMWSLMDCMEMKSGYDVRFGFFYTDYENNFKRIPKKSADWMKSFMD